jgi:spermidine synthase
MKPWEVIGRTQAPDGAELTLVRHPSELAILADGRELMSSRMHRSEEALAILGCERARTLPAPRVLVGGLGLGYTLRAALDILPSAAEVIVAELVPAVVEWNRGPIGPLANHPLDDARVRVESVDVATAIRSRTDAFDAILLDVDNGPTPLTANSNVRLYDDTGVAAARAALRPGGVLAIWSVSEAAWFERRLRAAGFTARRERVRTAVKRGGHHIVIVAVAVAADA